MTYMRVSGTIVLVLIGFILTWAIHCYGIVRIYLAVSLWITGLTRLASTIYVVPLDIGALEWQNQRK